MAIAALGMALVICLVGPRQADGLVVDPDTTTPTPPPTVGPELVTLPLDDGLVRVLADDAGHRFDGGRVREVEVGTDGTVWVAVGRRAVRLGTAGSIEPRAGGWRSFPRGLSVDVDGSLWAIEDGGSVVVLKDDRWTQAVDLAQPPRPGRALPEAMSRERLAELGVDGPVRVLASAPAPDGTVWFVADTSASPHVRPADHALLHLSADGWETIDRAAGMPQEGQRAWSALPPAASATIVVDQDGRVWFSIYRLGLFVFDGSEFERIEDPGLRLGALDLEIGLDGSIWIASVSGGLYHWTNGSSPS
jgi:streptogramin lyase